MLKIRENANNWPSTGSVDFRKENVEVGFKSRRSKSCFLFECKTSDWLIPNVKL